MDVNNVNDNSFNTIKTNTKKSQMKNDAARTIFDAVDINRDGIISQSEYKGIVKGKTRGKNGKIVVRDYIKVKDLENGRSLVVDKNGKQWIMAHDGSILKATYVAVQTAKENFQKAKKSFKKQKQKDGWAGKAADAISTLWNSKNRASVVSKDLGEHFQLLQQLFQSEKAGSKAFNTKFKEIFGVNYNEAAVTKYLADPTEANYQKAFGNKNNIQNRVEKYNQSQELGASVVKTSAAIAGTVALGVATGGTSLVATAAISAGTSLAVNASDRLSSEDGIKEEDAGTILKEAALDGITVGAAGKVAKLSNALIKGVGTSAKVARAGVNTAGDMIIGAGQEYIETGNVSASGVLLNAAPGALGIAAETGAFKKLGKTVKKKFSNLDKTTHQEMNNITDLEGNLVAGGLFSKLFDKSIALDPKKGWQNFKTADGEITLLVQGDKVYYGKVGSSYTKPITVKPGENKLLGHTSNGSSIILQQDANGTFKVVHMKPAKTPEYSTTKQHTESTTSQRKSKQVDKKVQENIVRANNDSGDPGHSVVSNKLKLAANKPEQVPVFDQSFNLTDVSNNVALGDVFAIGSGKTQKLYVNQNGAAIELKISKDKFEELFPPKGFALAEQNGYNNCWLVSRLNSMTESASGRAQLYSLLEETSSGDIIVNLKNAKPIRFPGGKPAAAVQTSLGDGASPGLEMIEQAVLVRYLQEPSERVTDISKLSLASLNNEANALSHTDREAVSSLLGKSAKQIGPQSANYEAEVKETLEKFSANNDMAVVTWGAHARSLVNYDKTTGMVTYHDPYYAGVDLVCTFEELVKKNPYFMVCKASSTPNVTQKSVATPTQAIVKEASTTDTQPQKKAASSKTNSNLIPEGYKEYTPAFGRRRIIGPDNDIMTEINGKWVKRNY